MTTIQKWLSAMAGLGALYLVLANPTGFKAFAGGVQTIVGGTEGTILRGGR